MGPGQRLAETVTPPRGARGYSVTHSRGEAVTQSGTKLVFFLRLSSYPLPLAQAVQP